MARRCTQGAVALLLAVAAAALLAAPATAVCYEPAIWNAYALYTASNVPEAMMLAGRFRSGGDGTPPPLFPLSHGDVSVSRPCARSRSRSSGSSNR